MLPDLILREEELESALSALALQVGYDPKPVPKLSRETPFTLADIYDDDIEKLAQDAYQRDYMMFGFDRWRESGSLD